MIKVHARDVQIKVVQVTYPGSNNFSTLAYDGLGRNVSIVETTAGSVTSTKNFVLANGQRCEERDSSGTLIKQFYARGEVIGSTKYAFAKDSLGSIRELADNSGIVQAEYAFDPYGRVNKIMENVAADFGYAGYYIHARSGLNLTEFRAYSALQGRFMSRDLLEEDDEDGGPNRYAYVLNSPIDFTDPLGLLQGDPTGGSASPGGSGVTNFTWPPPPAPIGFPNDPMGLPVAGAGRMPIPRPRCPKRKPKPNPFIDPLGYNKLNRAAGEDMMQAIIDSILHDRGGGQGQQPPPDRDPFHQ